MRDFAWNVRRTVATVALAAVWAGLALGSQFLIDPPAPLYDVWHSPAPMITAMVLAFGVGVHVARWPALLAALAPLATLAALDAGGHMATAHDPEPPLADWEWWTAFCAMPLAFGVVVGRYGLTPRPRPSARA